MRVSTENKINVRRPAHRPIDDDFFDTVVQRLLESRTRKYLGLLIAINT